MRFIGRCLPNTAQGVKLTTAAFICTVGVAYLLVMLARQRLESMDFRYIWLAGNLWAHGANPYSEAYKSAGAIQFPTGYAIAAWAYPFHWYIPARLAAELTPQIAFAFWLGTSTVALAGATWLDLSAARALGLAQRLEPLLYGLGYACSGSIVGYALRTGQPAVLAECGVAVVLFGVARNRSGYVVCGLVLAMLKPQIGLPFATAVCFTPKGFRNAFTAAALVLIASLPAFVASGFLNQIYGLLFESRNTYQAISYNTADLTSGLPHIIGLTTHWSLSITGSMLLASALTALTSWQLRGYAPQRAIALWIGLTCMITGAIVELHTYDLIVVLFTMPFLGAVSRSARAAAFVGFALLWRPASLVRLLGLAPIWMSNVQSISLLVILAAWVSTLVAARGDLRSPPRERLEPRGRSS